MEGELKILNENNQNLQEEFDQLKDVNEELKKQIQTFTSNQNNKKRLSEETSMGRNLEKYSNYIRYL